MKQFILLSVLFLSITFSYAQSWRSGEKQILITINSPEQAAVISELKFSYDIISENQIRAYVIPKEILHLDNSGILYQIEIDDLKSYSQSMQHADASWHSYQEIIDLADSLEQEFPAICAKHIFGTSIGGRQLVALKISDNVDVDEPEAEVMFDGGIHGDEYPAAENVIRFARDICIAYGTDTDITDLIDNREIWLYLMVNPDGRVSVSRYNDNGVDLNRDWAYMWNGEGSSTGPCSQVESKALRECMYNNQFVIHTTYHAGTEYISLPWSYRSNQPADWNHIYQLAGVYSNTSLYSNMTYGQGNTGMYPINGSTKDCNYGVQGSISWSMEISHDKMPSNSQIVPYYNKNFPAMLAMVEYAGYGLQGTVTDAVSGNAITGNVLVNNYYPTFTDPTAGDYHKYVLPGTYSITIIANGYETQTIDNVVVTENSATTTNFEMQPLDGQYVYKFASSQIPNNNEADEGFTPAVIGAPDDINYSIGKNGWCVLDMQYPVIDGSGFDILVHEGDATPEGYICYVGTTIDGPWISLGNGNGTTEFDIANSGLSEAQFIKILDDGDGSANVPDAGFDLDAIEVLPPVSGVYIALYNYEVDDSNGNNNGRIDPGETVNIIVNLKNNGDVTAENTTGTISTSSPYITINSGTAYFGNLTQGQSAQESFNITANAGTPLGEPIIIDLLVEANNGAYNNTFDIDFVVGLILEDWETGTFDQFDWETSGNADWIISNENPYEGIYCVKSGDIGDDQSSILSISFDVLTDGEISFFKKVSSEASYDYLRFYIDNNMVDQWSGNISWSEISYSVTSGQHTFKWEYEKDGSVSGGSDCGWVDYISLPSGAFNGIVASFTSDVTQVCETEIVNFYDASLGDVISWEWEFEGGAPATSTEENPTITYSNQGVYNVALTVSDGDEINTITLEDYITVIGTPETPTMPEGPVEATSLPNDTNIYNTIAIPNASSYIWELEPQEAGEIVENDIECTVDWTDYWDGLATLKVKAINDCGESDFSEELDIAVIITSIDNNIAGTIRIFPNPNNGNFTIHTSNQLCGDTKLEIINNLGKVVYRKQNLLNENKILDLNLSNFESGIYYLILKSDNVILKEKMIIY